LLSNIITALSTFFLAKDLDLLVAAPIGRPRLYLAKLGETIVHSSWMVALLALPIFTAYGIVYRGGLFYPVVALAAFIPYLPAPAQRVDRVDDHELVASGGRPVAGGQALDRRGACGSTRGAAAWPAVPSGILQGAGRRRTKNPPASPGAAGATSPISLPVQAGVHPQGSAAVLSGQHPVEPADTPHGPAD